MSLVRPHLKLPKRKSSSVNSWRLKGFLFTLASTKAVGGCGEWSGREGGRGWVGESGTRKAWLDLTAPAAALTAWTLVLLLPTAPSLLPNLPTLLPELQTTQCFTFESCLWKVTTAEMLRGDFLSCCLAGDLGWAIVQETSDRTERNLKPTCEDLNCVWRIWVIERVHCQWGNLVDGCDMILRILSTSPYVRPQWRFESWSSPFCHKKDQI